MLGTRPNPSAVEITAGRLADGSRLVRVTGDLDLDTAPAVELTIDELVDDGERVSLDLSGVVFVDVVGFQMLLWTCVLPCDGGDVHVVAASPAVHRMVEFALDVMGDVS